jgi:hypothetical protein
MRKVSLSALVAVSAVAALAPAVSQAQLSIGARSGYMYGFGDVGGFADLGTIELADSARSQIPFQLDVGYRFGDMLTLGGYFSYGVAFVSGASKDACDFNDADCSAKGLRFGAQAFLNFLPKQRVDPWLGVGIGYESLSVDGGGLETTARGVEGIVQSGIDFRPTPWLTVGPYASFSLGRYSELEVEDVGEAAFSDKGFHQWLTVGVRGEFDLGAETSARAQSERAHWSVGARAGYMFGLGDVGGGLALDGSGGDLALGDAVRWQLPVQLDVGYRITDRVTLGGYFSYGIGFPSGDLEDAVCDPGDLDCSVRSMRFGAQILVSLLPKQVIRHQECECDRSWSCDPTCACDRDCGRRQAQRVDPPVDPWVGLGIGYESVSIDFGGPDVKASGMEWLVAQAGIDFHPTPGFGIGPYASFSLGQYTDIDSEIPGWIPDGQIQDKTFHEWITVGLRGEFDF